MSFVLFNGDLYAANSFLFSAQNRGFRYGDGCFETMKVVDGSIRLAALHFERLFLSLQLLKMNVQVREENLHEQILLLCKQNSITELARVRLAFYRTENNRAEYVMEALPLTHVVNTWNDAGLKVDVFAHARKSIDAYANLKTANFLPYVLAELDAQEKGVDDCFVLNVENNICDTSKANAFLIKNEKFYTPALHQGCISGVMRRHLIDSLKKSGYAVHQQEITEQDLLSADEVFLTNAIFGMRWVQKFRDKQFSSALSHSLYQNLFTG